MAGYDHKQVEAQAQEKWESLRLYEADLHAAKDPYYVLFEFPYPSGDLHIGHWYAFALTDIFARYKRLEGKDVLFPIGFDSFGLPAENAAIKRGADPKTWTYENMERMRAQIRSMGTAVDWSKEIATSDPEFYKWTQWLFLKLYEHGLAERKEAPVKWCPKDQTVLANEQVIDGACERCGTEVEERRLTQWFLRITDYAERLLADLDPLPWREEIKDAQRAWIGKSEGAKITFPLSFKKDPTQNDWRDPDGKPAGITVFTTRPDTVFGATYVVLAPEHQWVRAIWDTEHDDVAFNKDEIAKYVEVTKRKTERERQENKEKTGVRIDGIMALNPATGEEIPVYIADYVLGSYGSGAVMAVPAHDERDFEFAKLHGLPVRQVVAPRVTDNTNPPQEGKEEVGRDVTLSIVHNPATNRYLTLDWKEQPWVTFITGGMDEGEEALATALREIKEETGYTDLELVRYLGQTQSEFYAAHKGVNRVARNRCFLFSLKSEARTEVAAEEEATHEVVWRTKEEIEALHMQHAEFDYLWKRIHEGDSAFTESGALIDSGAFSGRDSEEAKWDIVEAIGGERTTNYRLRDWLVSRQRYWGCPIPVVYDPDGKPHSVSPDHLPWMLPTDVDFSLSSDGSPLRTSKELKERVERLYGEGWTPEYDTLDTFVDSSWYFYRYLDPKDENDFSDAGLMRQWLPVDRYSGGSEHTTMHLLYSRFFHKALYDLALVPHDEPFNERNNRGIILGPDGQKMSKSKGNVVNPDEFVERYGADAVRLYLSFIGPYNEPGSYPWNLDGVHSMRRFLDRIVTVSERVRDVEATEELRRSLAKTIEKVGSDLERMKYNTAISALMVFLKDLEALTEVPRPVFHQYLILLAPLAPHLAEHLFGITKGAGSIHMTSWPEADLDLLKGELKTVIVQVSGKRKGEIQLPEDASEEDAIAAAHTIPAVAELFASSDPSRVVYVPGRILNLVFS
ncbi:MAG TPA: class I tRNA ligase family protein [Candidatus Paceibacterota bacterium]|nr:class I tRNA ligase family protein [Candidatus Paceibacterota bacterium]